MSTRFLPARYDERVDRLALGLEPVEEASGARVRHPIQILVELPAPGQPRPRLVRHRSGLFVMLQQVGVPTTLNLRLCDLGGPRDRPGFNARTDRRRLVPRRLSVTIPSADLADTLPLAHRARRPTLFPGAAYAVTDCVTGLRGRVEHNGVPVRWARLEARRPGAAPADPPVGRAHGDDRGEFLLLLESAAAPMTTLERPFELDLVVYAPIPPAVLPPQCVRDADGLWDLPVETLSLSGSPDPVAEGVFPPTGWGAGAAPARIELAYGRLLTGLVPLTL